MMEENYLGGKKDQELSREDKWRDKIDQLITAYRYESDAKEYSLEEFRDYRISQRKHPDSPFGLQQPGLYCFRLEVTDNGTLIVEIDAETQIDGRQDLQNLFFRAMTDLEKNRMIDKLSIKWV